MPLVALVTLACGLSLSAVVGHEARDMHGERYVLFSVSQQEQTASRGGSVELWGLISCENVFDVEQKAQYVEFG